jgi:ATP-binding cassette subfamily B protein
MPVPQGAVSKRKRGLDRASWLTPGLLVSLSLIGAAILVEAAFNAFIPLSIRYLIDRAMIPAKRDSFYLVCIVLGVGLAIALLTGLVRDHLASRAQSRFLSRLRQVMFERLQQSAMSLHPRNREPELIECFANDLGAVENAAAMAAPWGLLPAIDAFFSSLLLLYLNWRSGLAGLLLWPWVLLAPRVVAAKVHHATRASRNEEARMLGAVRENLLAQRLLRAFSLEKSGLSGFRKRNEVLSRSMTRAGLMAAFMERFTGSGILSIQVFLLGLSGWLAFEKQMSIGDFVAMQMLALMLTNALLSLVDYAPALSAAQEAYQRIRTVIEAPRPVREREGAKLLPAIQNEIVLASVDFSYDGRQQNLSGIRMRIPCGAYIAFAGPSGSGKSTMLNLLMRFYDPSAGFITIDGHDLKTVTLASLRGQMGVVLQDNPLFNASIRENILGGKPGASEEAVYAAAAAAGVHDFITTLPAGYNTVVGDHETSLPPAQVQRLAIARAILRDPPILLLDEVTSALDLADEIAINETLRELARGRTTISVTHRLATTADADQIFFFDHGRMIEQGSHFELLAANGTYASYWRKQAGFTFSADGRHVDVDARRLKAFPILERLDEEQLAELAPFFATETFQPGREIVCQNDPGDKFYIIARGKVEVWRTEEQSGKVTRVAVLQDGDYFGEITLITGFPRTATVRTLTVCTCISLERGQFNRMLDCFPELQRQISHVAVQRLRESSKAIVPGVH